MPYLKFIVNPDSFAQTIENIFYYSFLVRDGTAALEMDEDETSGSFGDIVACEFLFVAFFFFLLLVLLLLLLRVDEVYFLT